MLYYNSYININLIFRLKLYHVRMEIDMTFFFKRSFQKTINIHKALNIILTSQCNITIILWCYYITIFWCNVIIKYYSSILHHGITI